VIVKGDALTVNRDAPTLTRDALNKTRQDQAFIQWKNMTERYLIKLNYMAQLSSLMKRISK
jgi:hypothetical protein